MNFKILIVSIICLWKCLSARFAPSNPQGVTSCESLKIGEIRDPKLIKQNMKIANTLFARDTLDDVLVIKLEFLCFYINTLMTEGIEAEDLMSSPEYTAYYDLYAKFKQDYEYNLLGIFRKFLEKLYTDKRAFHPDTKDFQLNLDCAIFLAITSVSLQGQLYYGEIANVFSILLRLTRNGQNRIEISIVLPELIKAHSLFEISGEWKARADDPSQEECISDHPDDFGKFKIFLATVGLVEELRSNDLAQNFVDDFTLSDRQASGFKKLLMDMYLKGTQTSIEHDERVIYTTLLRHYESGGLTEQGYTDQLQIDVMERIIENVQGRKRVNTFDYVVGIIVIQHFKSMTDDERSVWSADRDCLAALLGLQLAFDYNHNKLGETTTRFYVLGSFKCGNDMIIISILDRVIPLVQKPVLEKKEVSELHLLFKAICYATEPMRTADISPEALQELLDNENFKKMQKKLGPYLGKKSDDFKKERSFFNQQIKVLSKKRKGPRFGDTAAKIKHISIPKVFSYIGKNESKASV